MSLTNRLLLYDNFQQIMLKTRTNLTIDKVYNLVYKINDATARLLTSVRLAKSEHTTTKHKLATKNGDVINHIADTIYTRFTDLTGTLQNAKLTIPTTVNDSL